MKQKDTDIDWTDWRVLLILAVLVLICGWLLTQATQRCKAIYGPDYQFIVVKVGLGKCIYVKELQ